MKKSHLLTLSVIFIVIFMLLAYSQYRYANIPNELEKQSPYTFEVQIDPSHEFRLTHTLIYYDVLKRRGNINFTVDSGSYPDHFVIRLPRDLEMRNISIKNDSIELKEGIDYILSNKSTDKKNIFDLYDFQKSLEDCHVSVEFEGELIPNAEFFLDFVVERASPSYKSEFFYFDIGDYYCSSPENCLSSDWDSLEAYDYRWKSESENDVLAVAKIDRNSLLYEKFYLKVEQSKTKLEEKQNYNQMRFMLLGSLIGCIVGLIVGFILGRDET